MYEALQAIVQETSTHLRLREAKIDRLAALGLSRDEAVQLIARQRQEQPRNKESDDAQ